MTRPLVVGDGLQDSSRIKIGHDQIVARRTIARPAQKRVRHIVGRHRSHGQ